VGVKDVTELYKHHAWVEQPPSEASYIVFRIADRYYAKNGETGEIEYSSDKPVALVQKILDLTRSGSLVCVKCDIESDETIKFPHSDPLADPPYRDRKTLVILGEVRYKGTEEAISFNRGGWCNLVFNRIYTPGSTAKYGMRILGGGYNRIVGMEIGEAYNPFTDSCLFFDPVNAVSDFVGNVIDVNRLHGGESPTTPIPLRLDSGDHNFEGNRVLIKCIMRPGSIGTRVGSDTAVQSFRNNFFLLDVDAGPSGVRTATALIDIYNEYNTVLLEAWTQSAGASDVVVRADNCLVITSRPEDLRIDRVAGKIGVCPARKEVQLVLVRTLDGVSGNAGVTYASHYGTYYDYVPDRFNPAVIEAVLWYVMWNPNTTAGGVSLYNVSDGVDIAVSEPGVVGLRTDIVDVTAAIRGYTTSKAVCLRTKGDGVTAPIIYRSELFFRFRG